MLYKVVRVNKPSRNGGDKYTCHDLLAMFMTVASSTTKHVRVYVTEDWRCDCGLLNASIRYPFVCSGCGREFTPE